MSRESRAACGMAWRLRATPSRAAPRAASSTSSSPSPAAWRRPSVSHVLDRILAAKRREVEERRAKRPLAELQRAADQASAPRGFERALRAKIAAGKPGVIAEIKR